MNRSLLIIIAVLVNACDTSSLLYDPSFDLWCSEQLCSPWEAMGSIERVKTWHRSDYGVELGDGSVLSQLSTRAATDCIELGLIADVAASAEVSVEMDFDDDGNSEFKQLVPESRWAVLNFEVQTPGRYKNMRFILRKTGHGRAVIAQVTTSANCPPESLPQKDRINGTHCNTAAQCASGVCAERRDSYAFSRQTLCGECDSEHSCPDGLRCGAALRWGHLIAACVPPKAELGDPCEDDSQCSSAHCASTGQFGDRTCGQCAADEHCAPGQVCGWGTGAIGPARQCVEAHSLALGAGCESNAECESGSCNANTCVQCLETSGCPEGTCVQMLGEEQRIAVLGLPKLCIRGSAGQREGEPCNRSEDCESAYCHRPAPGCYYCADTECQAMSIPGCAPLRQFAGVCR